MSYINETVNVYKEAALKPDVGLCCTTTPVWQLPGLKIPSKMLEMNYGCGSTVHPRDLVNSPAILYVGVGGGMEVLQFSYFSRNKGKVIGVDLVDEMLECCEVNLNEAAQNNDWFDTSFVDLRKGTALKLPVEDESIDVAAQNCLFNIFKMDDLKLALQEMYRVLKPHGKLVLSDPISEDEIPRELREDDRLRALCLSGVISLKQYVKMLTDVGFGTVEVRAKRAYRILDKASYATDKNIYIESIEICAMKDPVPSDGPCVFTGKTAIYFGGEEYYDDNKGHVIYRNSPMSVCDKTANNLASLNREDIFISPSTFHYDGGGCC